MLFGDYPFKGNNNAINYPNNPQDIAKVVRT